ncbi:hypothetical protein [Rhizobium fabae]|uniref:Uncharacterized protein n=1 Tax=Rhizobium fabae TaxID=573179 RepID=A0A7W6FIH1_9HYPH|nr:hypothetical protein [Rhizobium fabae]MBB3914930.1 hypothetical protein [Rhizobium fabae]
MTAAAESAAPVSMPRHTGRWQQTPSRAGRPEIVPMFHVIISSFPAFMEKHG